MSDGPVSTDELNASLLAIKERVKQQQMSALQQRNDYLQSDQYANYRAQAMQSNQRAQYQASQMQNAHSGQMMGGVLGGILGAGFGGGSLYGMQNIRPGGIVLVDGQTESPVISRYRRKLAARKAAESAKARPPLSLKTSPLFGYMRWDFESPFKKLELWFLRWTWRVRRRA